MFVVECPLVTVAGYLKFKGKGEPPERNTGPIFPRDQAPSRASLGDIDRANGEQASLERTRGPLDAGHRAAADHKETGEAYILHRAVEDGYRCSQGLVLAVPAITGWARSNGRLDVGIVQGKFGKRKKPVFSLDGAGAANRDGV